MKIALTNLVPWPVRLNVEGDLYQSVPWLFKEYKLAFDILPESSDKKRNTKV